MKRLSEEKPIDGAERDTSTAAKHAEHGDERETSPRPSWSQEEDEEGGGTREGGEKEEEAPPSSTDRLRDGIRAALSSIVPYKSQWPHVCTPTAFYRRKFFSCVLCFILTLSRRRKVSFFQPYRLHRSTAHQLSPVGIKYKKIVVL